MKNLIFIFSICLVLFSCKTSENVVSQYDTKTPQFSNDKSIELEYYPIDFSKDSIQEFFNSEMNETNYYVIEQTRVVVLNENFEIIRIESK